ncbi:hypothetical protein CPT_Slocum_034 [Serratia phage Slocum]|nr:hypothetical protein CPT_Slocum_034 [Serratia phage Slocum]
MHIVKIVNFMEDDLILNLNFEDNSAVISTFEGDVLLRLEQEFKDSDQFANGYFNTVMVSVHDGIEVDPISDTMKVHLVQPIFESPEECIAKLEQHFGLIAKEYE